MLGVATPELRLIPKAPFDGAGLLAFLARRAVAGIERVADGVYARSVSLPGGAAVVELAPGADHVDARFTLADADDVDEVVRRSRALLDLDADVDAIGASLGPDELLGPLVEREPGRRVPGHVDGCELAIRAVIGQQVSVAAAATVTARLVAAYGERLKEPLGTITHSFPTSEALAALDPAGLPMPRSRGRTLVTLAQALAAGDLELAPQVDPVDTCRRLLELPGIGPWTADYIAMRALGDRDAFLPSDLGVRHALEGLGESGDPKSAARLAQRWRPYRSYALMHLWATLDSA